MAVICTRPGVTEIVPCSSASAACNPKSSAGRQLSGGGKAAVPVRSVISVPAFERRSAMALRSVRSGSRPISDRVGPCRISSSEKSGGSSRARSATSIRSSIRRSSMRLPTALSARNRAISSGAVPESCTFSPLVEIRAQGSSSPVRAARAWARLCASISSAMRVAASQLPAPATTSVRTVRVRRAMRPPVLAASGASLDFCNSSIGLS